MLSQFKNHVKRSTAKFLLSLMGFLMMRDLSAHARHYDLALMASLGDSLTAATLSDTTLIESEDHLKGGFSFLRVFQDILFGVGANHTYYSWSSGREIKSHFMQLQSWMKTNEPRVGLTVKNVAVPGVTAEGLKDQAKKIIKELETGKYTYLKYVTVTIGGNDICAYTKDTTGTEPEDFEHNVREMFKVFSEIKQQEPISILIAAIPNVPHLGEKKFQELEVGNGYTCDYIRRNTHNSCPNLLLWENDREYATALQTVVDQNNRLRALAKEAMDTHKNLRTHFSEVFFDYEVTPEMLGYDCFHPNKYGHALLSKLSFLDQPFFPVQ